MTVETLFLVVGVSVPELEVFSKMLDGCQDIDCSWFPVDPGTAGDYDSVENYYGSMIDARYADYATGSSANACGFVLPMLSGQANHKAVLVAPEVKKIVLSRSNMLASYLAKQRKEHARRLAFVHIPKTAGMSLHSVLKKSFGEDVSYRAGDAQNRAAFLKAPFGHYFGYRYMTGHLSLKEMVDKGVDAPFVSVIRNPIDRLGSLFRYINNSDHGDHKGLNFRGVDQFVKYLQKQRLDDMQCWQFGNNKSFKSAIEYINRHHVYVAPLEYYDDFLVTLSEVLGDHLENVHENISPKGRVVSLTDDDIQKLLPFVQEDLKLFEYIHDNYDAIKQRFMENLMRKTDLWKQEKVTFNDRDFTRYQDTYLSLSNEILGHLDEMKQDYLLLNGCAFDVDQIEKVLRYLNVPRAEVCFGNSLAKVCENVVDGFSNPGDARSYIELRGQQNWTHESFTLWQNSDENLIDAGEK